MFGPRIGKVAFDACSGDLRAGQQAWNSRRLIVIAMDIGCTAIYVKELVISSVHIGPSQLRGRRCQSLWM